MFGSNHLGSPHESGYWVDPIVNRIPPSPFATTTRIVAVGIVVVVVVLLVVVVERGIVVVVVDTDVEGVFAIVVAVVDSDAVVVDVVDSVSDPPEVVGVDTEIDCLKPRLLTGA